MGLVFVPFFGCVLIFFLAANAALILGFVEKDMARQSARNVQAVTFFAATIAWMVVLAAVAAVTGVSFLSGLR